MRGTRASTGRILPALLVAAALLLRIAVPAGWMPASDAEGGMRITLCTGYGMVQAWVDDEGKIHRSPPNARGAGNDGSKDGGKSAPDHCPFTASALSLAQATTPDLPEIQPQPHVLPALERLETIPGRGLAAPPPPQTGPPALA